MWLCWVLVGSAGVVCGGIEYQRVRYLTAYISEHLLCVYGKYPMYAVELNRRIVCTVRHSGELA